MVVDGLRGLAALAVATIAATWVLYPVGVWLASRLRPVLPTAAPPEAARVSIVIASREDADAIGVRIANALTTDWPADKVEVVVALDRGAAPAVEPTDPRVRVVRADAPGGKAAALNAGVREAGGAILVFADTFQRFDHHTIPALVSALADPRVGAVTGNLELVPGSSPILRLYWSFEKWLRRAEARLHSSVGATGAVYAMRRSLWKDLPSGLILDDLYTPLQVVLAGYRVAFAVRARAFETRAPTPSQEYGRKVRTLTGVLQLVAWLPAILSPRRNPIWLPFIFHKLLRLLTPYCIVVVGLYLTVLVGVTVGVNGALVGSAVAALIALWIWRSRRGRAAQFRRIAHQGFLIQMAIVRAGVNGMRRDWQVWDD